MKAIGKLCEGEPHTQFDEGVLETGRWRELHGHKAGNGGNRQVQPCTLPRQCSTLLVVTGKSKEALELQVLPLLERFLARRGLTISAKKTAITHIRQGFDFLSQNVRKYGTSIIIKPSKDSIKRMLKRVRRLIKVNSTQTQERLIDLLNPLIRGWGNYHKAVCARKIFEKVDHEIFQSLWRWSKRRHPNKGMLWIKNKYFKTRGNQRWCFATKAKVRDKVELKELFKTTNLLIRRHRKIRAKANPFDKEWYEYFAQRALDTRAKKSFVNLAARSKV